MGKFHKKPTPGKLDPGIEKAVRQLQAHGVETEDTALAMTSRIVARISNIEFSPYGKYTPAAFGGLLLFVPCLFAPKLALEGRDDIAARLAPANERQCLLPSGARLR